MYSEREKTGKYTNSLMCCLRSLWVRLRLRCGRVQSPLLHFGDAPACMCNTWSEYNSWLLLTPKQPKFVTWRMKGNICFIPVLITH